MATTKDEIITQIQVDLSKSLSALTAYKDELTKLEHEIKNIKSANRELAKNFDENQGAISRNNEELVKLEQRHKAVKNSEKEVVAAVQAEARAREQAAKTAARQREDLEKQQKQLEAYKTWIAELKKEIAEYTRAMAQLEAKGNVRTANNKNPTRISSADTAQYNELLQKFKAAQASLTALEAKEKELTAVVKGETSEQISARQKLINTLAEYKTHIESLKAKIQSLEQENAKLSGDFKGNAQAIEANNRKIVELNNELKVTQAFEKSAEKSLQQMTNASNTQATSLEALRKKYTELNNAYAKLSNEAINSPMGQNMKAQIESVKSEIDKIEHSFGNWARNVGNYAGGIIGSIKKIGLQVIGIQTTYMLIQKLTGAIKDTIKTAMEFQRTTSQLSAILQTTKESTAALNAQARELGATTSYTATQVTQLQIELAKLGYQKDQILQMTAGVLNFAKATGSELGEAAALTGAALRMFQDSALNTTQYVDQMATATTHSALSFSYLQTALPIVGAVANAFNFKLDDTLALLGQLANAGFDASMAATATRNIILNLANANGDLAKQLGKPVTNLKELVAGLKKLESQGINLGEALQLTDKRSVAAFNTFLRATDGVTDLKNAMAGTSKEAQALGTTTKKSLQDIIDGTGELSEKIGLPVETVGDLKRALKSLGDENYNYKDSLGLVDTASEQAFQRFLEGAEDSEKLQDALTGCDGAAERMAHTMADNLHGDVVALSSAWDEFCIALNDSQGPLREVIQKITELVRQVDALLADAGTVQQRYNNGATEQYTNTNGSYMRTNTSIDERQLKRRVAQYKKQGLNEAKAYEKATADMTAEIVKIRNKNQAELDKIQKQRLNNTTAHSRRNGKFSEADRTYAKAQTMSTADINDILSGKNVLWYQAGTKHVSKENEKMLKEILSNRKKEATLVGKIAGENARIQTLQDAEAARTRNNKGAGIVTDKQRRAQEAAARKAKAEQDKYDNNDKRAEQQRLKALQAYEDEMNKIIGDSIEARRAKVDTEFEQLKAQLELTNKEIRKTINKNDHLTPEAKADLEATIEYNKKRIIAAENTKNLELEKLNRAFDKQAIQELQDRLNAEAKLIELDIQKKADLSKRQEDANYQGTIQGLRNDRKEKSITNINLREQTELQSVKAGSDEALAIQEKYQRLRELAQKEMWDELAQIDEQGTLGDNLELDKMCKEGLDIITQYNSLEEFEELRHQQALQKIKDDAAQATLDKKKQALANEIAQMQLDYQTQQDEEQGFIKRRTDLTTQGELDILKKKEEAATQELQALQQRGRLSTQTEEEYQAEIIGAKQKEADARSATNAAEVKNEQAAGQAMGQVTNNLIGLLDELGKTNEDLAKASKVVALAKIAIDTGVALAEGVKSASGVPFPGNLAAIATTVAAVLANITSAISTVKSAKFAQGGKVEGPGTGTSDSIPASLSNGEYVMTAKATKLFEPLLAAMNSIGSGAPMQLNDSYRTGQTVTDLTESFTKAAEEIQPVVSVVDINEGQQRVKLVQNLDNL